MIFWKWVLEKLSIEFKNGCEGGIKERKKSRMIEVFI